MQINSLNYKSVIQEMTPDRFEDMRYDVHRQCVTDGVFRIPTGFDWTGLDPLIKFCRALLKEYEAERDSTWGHASRPIEERCILSDDHIDDLQDIVEKLERQDYNDAGYGYAVRDYDLKKLLRMMGGWWQRLHKRWGHYRELVNLSLSYPTHYNQFRRVMIESWRSRLFDDSARNAPMAANVELLTDIEYLFALIAVKPVDDSWFYHSQLGQDEYKFAAERIHRRGIRGIDGYDRLGSLDGSDMDLIRKLLNFAITSHPGSVTKPVNETISSMLDEIPSSSLLDLARELHMQVETNGNYIASPVVFKTNDGSEKEPNPLVTLVNLLNDARVRNGAGYDGLSDDTDDDYDLNDLICSVNFQLNQKNAMAYRSARKLLELVGKWYKQKTECSLKSQSQLLGIKNMDGVKYRWLMDIEGVLFKNPEHHSAQRILLEMKRLAFVLGLCAEDFASWWTGHDADSDGIKADMFKACRVLLNSGINKACIGTTARQFGDLQTDDLGFIRQMLEKVMSRHPDCLEYERDRWEFSEATEVYNTDYVFGGIDGRGPWFNKRSDASKVKRVSSFEDGVRTLCWITVNARTESHHIVCHESYKKSLPSGRWATEYRPNVDLAMQLKMLWESMKEPVDGVWFGSSA